MFHSFVGDLLHDRQRSLDIAREVKRVNNGVTRIRTINRVDGQIITPTQIFKSIAQV